MENKTSDAQKQATNKWRKNNPEKTRYTNYKSTAKTFIRNWATSEDLKELKKLIEEKEDHVNE